MAVIAATLTTGASGVTARKSIDVWIPGKPRGKDRPRFVRATGRTFTTKETAAAELAIRDAWYACGAERLDGPLDLDVAICVERSASHFRRGGELSAEGLRHVMPDNQKPDVDNCLKLVMDSLNGLAYKDDVQIVGAYVSREWSEAQGIRIRIGEAVRSTV